ncbi:MAG: hypothetical protein K0Q87_3429 [Neobacillus sp.]|jgi:hypothetical protein|nr:hypothetical protein [Neobacillus sp.]
MKLVSITYKATAANCPLCDAYSSFQWGNLVFNDNNSIETLVTFQDFVIIVQTTQSGNAGGILT